MKRNDSSTQSAPIRERIAREAARLIARGKAVSYHTARVRATRWLSQQKLTSADIPTQAEILQQLQLLTLTTRWDLQQLLQYEVEQTARLLAVAPLFLARQSSQAFNLAGLQIDWLTATSHLPGIEQRLLNAKLDFQKMTLQTGLQQIAFYYLLPQRVYLIHPQLWSNAEILRHIATECVELQLADGSIGFDLWSQSVPAVADIVEEDVADDESSWVDQLLPLLQPLARWEWNDPNHPEGEGLYHVLQVFELGREKHPWDEEFLWACLLHDIGYVIDARHPTEATLKAIEPIVTPRVLFLIERLEQAHRYLQGETISRGLRKEESFEELLDLARCDRAGRVPGQTVPTLAEACQYLENLASQWDTTAVD